jgi:phosphoribosylanthranilate isomerase
VRTPSEREYMLLEPTITRVKICCIASVEEAWMAIRHGACAVGLVSEMPSGPGVIPEEKIAEIAAALPPAVGSFLLTSKQDALAIIAQQRRCGVNTVQLCDRVEVGAYEQLHAGMPGVSIVQVIHVMGNDAIEEAREVAPYVNGILLDSGDPSLPRKELGGTGRTHNWAISRQIVEQVGVPIFLAGGLRPDNVGEAIRVVRPYAVDVCTGVRTDGKLDEVKLAAFFESVRRS